MNRDDAIKLLAGGANTIAEWNYRRAVGEFHPPNLSGIDLAGVALDGANLSYANLEGADLTGAKLARADLHRTRLSHALLANAIFTEAHLHDTNLVGANLSGARFTHATIAHVDFERANLEGAIFIEAWLIGGRFAGASLKGAVFGYTYLSSILHGALGLEEAKHLSRSRVALDTLLLFEPPPNAFLRGCGVQEEDIAYLRSRAAQAGQFRSVFISYSHADRIAAEWLHGQLQSRGIRCWLDSHNLQPGDRILDAVDHAIRSHDRVLLCCSKHSLESWWVKDELRKAHERERREGSAIVVPVLFDRYLLDSWEDGLASDLRSRKAVDLTTWVSGNSGSPSEFEFLVGALRSG